jgi:hypothetical protein
MSRKHKMKNKTLFFVIPVLLVLLISCKRAINDSDTQNTKKEWLQDLACAFPCWQNITPQETKFEDVVPILLSVNATVRSEDKDHISFLFEKTISGLVYKATNNLVDYIILDLQQAESNIGNLEDVIGTPERISFIRIPGISYCLVNLLYPDQGIIVEANLENRSKSNNYLDCQFEIASDNEAFRLILIGQNFSDNALWKRATSTLNDKAWKGYGKYP